MSRRRGAPQGGAPSRRRTGRNRRRQDVYAYVEGGTEHDYLRYLNSQFGGDLGFHLNIDIDRAKGMTPAQMLGVAKTKARELANEEGHADRARSSGRPAPERTKVLPVWVFFDRDDNPEDELARVHDRAACCRVNVAFSHPCFELWLYLHLADSPGPQGGQRARLHDRLRRVHSAYVDYAASRGSKRLDAARCAALAGQEGLAVRRARALVAYCDTGQCDHRVDGCRTLDRDPSTGVYLLLEALGIVPP